MSAEEIDKYMNGIAKRLHNPSQFGTASDMVVVGFSKNIANLVEDNNSPDCEDI